MAIEYDEKGKFFTDVISKDVILADIQTVTHRLRGNVHVRKGDRLSDEVNQPNLFLPVTDVQILGSDGESLVTCSFMVLNRSHIIWMTPVADQQPPSK